MAEDHPDIRVRLGVDRARREGQRLWDTLNRFNRDNAPTGSNRRDYSDIIPPQASTTVGKPLPKPPGYPSNLWFVCARLGIPYDPMWVHRSQHRGEFEGLTITDVTDEAEVADDGRRTVPVNTNNYEPETWVLDAEYLENAYLLNGTPDPECYLWDNDVYERAWISVGLVLKDEAFKHVSTSLEIVQKISIIG